MSDQLGWKSANGGELEKNSRPHLDDDEPRRSRRNEEEDEEPLRSRGGREDDDLRPAMGPRIRKVTYSPIGYRLAVYFTSDKLIGRHFDVKIREGKIYIYEDSSGPTVRRMAGSKQSIGLVFGLHHSHGYENHWQANIIVRPVIAQEKLTYIIPDSDRFTVKPRAPRRPVITTVRPPISPPREGVTPRQESLLNTLEWVRRFEKNTGYRFERNDDGELILIHRIGAD